MDIQLQGNGEVYMCFRIPDTIPESPLDVDEFAARLKTRLCEMTRVGEIVGDEERDSVIVNLTPQGEFSPGQFYDAVGMTAVEHLMPTVRVFPAR